MTQGPPMKAKGASPPSVTEPIWSLRVMLDAFRRVIVFFRGFFFGTRSLTRAFLAGGFFSAELLFKRRLDKVREKRVRSRGLGLELRVELAAQEPGMAAHFHHLDQLAVRRKAAE